MQKMRSDDLLMVMAVSGAALTCFYIVAECLSWKTVKAADLRSKLNLRELYKKLHAATKPLVNRAIRRKPPTLLP
jgi:hypothetical protein